MKIDGRDATDQSQVNPNPLHSSPSTPDHFGASD
jgi:hypothetical protein